MSLQVYYHSYLIQLSSAV